MVGLAMGVSVEELQIDRHFVESAELLKELNII
jgi:heterodisulfide reductase subunit B